VLLHLEFYSVPPKGPLMDCERITYNVSSVDLAIVHARDTMENRSFAFGKAKVCVIKNEDGKILCQMRARRFKPSG
jgi:hypothetical protein